MDDRNIEAIYALSPVQEAIILGPAGPDATVNCRQVSCSFDGQLNVGTLAHAWQRIIDRHAVLRTAFAWKHGGKPVQVVRQRLPLTIEHSDWRGFTPVQQRELLEQLLLAERERGFNASMTPLMRLTLCRLAEDAYQFVWTYHRLILDDWSVGLILRQLAACYRELSTGKECNGAPANSYSSYISWLSGQEQAEAEDFWRTSLDGLPAPTRLQAGRVSASMDGGPSHCVSQEVRLSGAVTESLRSLARAHQLSPVDIAQGAWVLLLSRYSGDRNVVVGAVISGRPETLEDAASIVGPFTNAVPLKVEVPADARASSWLKELKERIERLRRYGYVSLVQLRAWSDAPPTRLLFESCLVLDDVQGLDGSLSIEDGKLNINNARIFGEAECPLAVQAVDGRELSLRATSYGARFDGALVTRMLGHWSTLLEALANDLEQPLSKLPLLTAPEQQQVLLDWNKTASPYPKDKCVHQLFQAQAGRTPEAVALIFGRDQLTYGELEHRSTQLARYLKRLGVGPEVRVGIRVERSLEMIVGVLGILKAGGAYVPLDLSDPLERIDFILNETQAPVLLTQEHLLGALPVTWTQVVCLDSDWEKVADESVEPLSVDALPENLAYVMYTSGSTGRPKGVGVPHRGIVRLVKGTNYASFTSDRVFLQLAPLSFDASTFEIWGALLNGAKLVLMPPHTPSLTELGQALNEYGVTTLWLTAGLFHLMVEQRLEDLRGLRQLIAGGDALSVPHINRALEGLAGTTLVNGYGPTESTTFACCGVLSEIPEDGRPAPIGTPVANTRVYLLDERMEPVPVGVSGELHIGGDGLARGYFNEPKLTAERFVPAPFGEAGGRLYRTGDRALYLPDGRIEFLGRVDGQIKIRGFRVEIGEVEAMLAQHPSVRDAAVIARADGLSKHLVAYVVANPLTPSSADKFQSYLRERLPEYMVPSAVILLDALPLTRNGKVDRNALPAPESVQPEPGETYTAPQTRAEEILAAVWSQVLGIERVGIDDNFFALGGDSIRSIQVVSLVEQKGLNLPVDKVFECQTIRELAREATTVGTDIATGSTAFSLVHEEDRRRLPAEIEDAYPLTMLQAGMIYHSELSPESAPYHDILSYHIRTPFDPQVLEMVMQQLLTRHPMLRTSFDLRNYSEPLQLVHQTVAVPLLVDDLSQLSPVDQDEALVRWIEEEKKHPLDWNIAPLLRVYLHRRTDQSFQFTLSLHHAILDGWSVSNLQTDLFARYWAALHGVNEPAEAPLATTFRDYVALERKALASTEVKRYWVEKLKDSEPTLVPRWPFEPQTSDSDQSPSIAVPISRETSEDLRRLADAAIVPLKSVLVAAHLRVLNLLSGQSDLVTGLVSHGRPETGDAGQVMGLFLNALPFRMTLAGGTWAELVQEAFAAEKEMLPYRWYPMAQIQNDTGGQPLYETAFTFTRFHALRSLGNLSGVEVLQSFEFAKTNIPFAPFFRQEPSSSQLELHLDYDPTQISGEQVSAIARYYELTLAAMAENPSAPYESACLLPPEEQRLLRGWNETATPPRAVETVHQFFEQQVERTPDAVAAVSEEGSLTYRELDRRANQLAQHLRSLGVRPEVIVALCVEPSLEMLVGVLGIMKAGGSFVSLDPAYPLERLAFMLEETAAPVLVTEERLLDRLPAHWAQVVCMDTDAEMLDAYPATNPSVMVDGEHAVYLVYTSGSTGNPKAIQTTHRALLNVAASMIELSGLDATHRLLQFVSLSFDAATQQIFMTLGTGASLVLSPNIREVPPLDLLHKCDQLGVTTLYLPPTYWHQMVDDLSSAERRVPEWLKLVLVGGESPSAERLAKWGQLSDYRSGFVNAYGPAEATVSATFYKAPPEADALSALTRVPIGRPIDNVEIYVLDRYMQMAPVGSTGELYIGGAGLARGYLRRPELTAEKFIPHPFSSLPGSRLYRTGDHARRLPGGEIEFLGRADEQVKVRGYRIEPAEIEGVLLAHSGVREAAVAARDDEAGRTRLIAYVVGGASGWPGAGVLREWVAERLPGYMVPAAFVELGRLPLTANGKVDRRALPELGAVVASTGNGAGSVEARTPIEALLAEIWAGVLGAERVGVEDNFFDLGGHSLLATQIISRVRETCGVEVTLRALFETPTVAGLAAVVEAGLRGEQPMSEGAAVQPRAVAGGAAPLSFAQQRLWFLDQLRPGNPFNNIPTAFRLEGTLDVSVLERCLSKIVSRHEALRTSFSLVDGQPVQVIHPARPVSVPVKDLRHLTANEKEAEVRGLMTAEVQQPFDLSGWPLFRFSLFRLDDEESIALVTMHHIISDGWSIGIITRELAALYAAFSAGESSPLPEVKIQYADFAIYQREWLQDSALERQLSYWTKQLDGMSQVMALPSDHPRSTVQSFSGAKQMLELPASLSAGLAELSRREGVTLFMTMLAAFEVLLHRYTGEVDVVIGTDVANRNRREVEDIVGFFVNQLVLRTDLSGKPTFSEVLSRVRRVALEAYAHQDLPFEKLVEALQPVRDLSHTPLFQVKFVFQNAPAEVFKLPDLKLSFVESETGISRYDLILTMEESEGRLFGVLEYNTDLFEEATIGRLISHYQTLLEAAVAAPEQSISTLRLLSEAERRQLLIEWNATERQFPEESSIQALFETQVELHAEATALIAGGEDLSYGELNRRANQLAHHLRTMGVGPEVRVCICLERTPEIVVGIFGILKAGGAYVPLDPAYPLDRLSFMLEDSRAQVILTSDSLVDKLPATWARVVLTDADAAVIAGQSVENPVPLCMADNLAYVIYTSGTTGVPKGVQVQHRSVINLIKWQADNFRLTSNSRVSQIFSYNFDGAVGETFMALLNGATLVMLGADSLDPVRLAEDINRYGITVGVFVPSMIRQLDPALLTHPERLSIVSVGEACPEDLALRWSRTSDFMNAYGPTEYTVYSHLWRVDESKLAGGHSIPIGTPIHNTKSYILDAQMNPVPVGVVGEIYISGQGLARGYLNQVAETATKFVPNPFVMEHELLLRGPLVLESALRDIEEFKEKRGSLAPGVEDERNVFSRLSPEAVMELVGELDDDLLEATRSFVEDYGGDEVAYDCFCRYLLEGARDSFASCGTNGEVLRALFPFEDFRGLRGVEFCFGNGEIMRTLAAEGAVMKGFDLNPFFVQKARKQGLDAAMAKVDVAFEFFVEKHGINEGSQDFALSVLALDRIEAPAKLLENLLRMLKRGGKFVVQTLLPIIPTDDGEVENPITYTPPDNRITPGGTVEQDKQALAAVLYRLGARDINIHQLPYVVTSRDGVQTYDVWSFSGAKGSELTALSQDNCYGRLYRTGDLARYMEDGRIEYLGRTDQQVKIRGFRIELGEVEAALATVPGVHEVAVTTRDGADGGRRLVGYVVAESGVEVTVGELRRELRERLPAHMVPETFVLLDALPLTPNGKIDREKLPSPDESRPELEDAFVPPRTDVERTIAGVWQELLKLEHVGVNDNFFELGGHSLLMIEVNAKLRETFKRELSVTELFQYPTVATLAAYLAQAEGEAPSFEDSRERARKQHEAMDRRKERLKEKRAKL